jgi:hypothetical protein
MPSAQPTGMSGDRSDKEPGGATPLDLNTAKGPAVAEAMAGRLQNAQKGRSLTAPGWGHGTSPFNMRIAVFNSLVLVLN